MRPDEVLAETHWPDGMPRLEEVNAALIPAHGMGNLEAHLDTAAIATIALEDIASRLELDTGLSPLLREQGVSIAEEAGAASLVRDLG